MLLADPEGELKVEFRDWAAQLNLEPGSLIPLDYPWVVDGKELSPEERSAQFSFDLDLLLRSRGQQASIPASPGTTVSPHAGSWTPADVLRALLGVRSAWGLD